MLKILLAIIFTSLAASAHNDKVCRVELVAGAKDKFEISYHIQGVPPDVTLRTSGQTLLNFGKDFNVATKDHPLAFGRFSYGEVNFISSYDPRFRFSNPNVNMTPEFFNKPTTRFKLDVSLPTEMPQDIARAKAKFFAELIAAYNFKEVVNKPYFNIRFETTNEFLKWQETYPDTMPIENLYNQIPLSWISKDKSIAIHELLKTAATLPSAVSYSDRQKIVEIARSMRLDEAKKTEKPLDSRELEIAFANLMVTLMPRNSSPSLIVTIRKKEVLADRKVFFYMSIHDKNYSVGGKKLTLLFNFEGIIYEQKIDPAIPAYNHYLCSPFTRGPVAPPSEPRF